MFLYDKAAGQSSELEGLESACRLDRALWFAQREQMLCQLLGDDRSFVYRFVGLDGSRQERLPLPPERDLKPLAFLPDQDVLILSERWRGRLSDRSKWAVWAYRFDAGEFYRLLDDQHLGDHVLYVRD